jgi:hypothetical protein
MIKTRPLPLDIEERLPLAARYLEGMAEVVFAYLFGGVAMGRRTLLSDLDLAVFLRDDCDPGRAQLELGLGLVDVLGTEEIDLVILNTASLSLAGRVLLGRKVLVDKDPFRRHRYESLVMRQYADFSVKERVLLEARFRRG